MAPTPRRFSTTYLMENVPEYPLKILVVGDPMTGKSTIIKTYVQDNPFDKSDKFTIVTTKNTGYEVSLDVADNEISFVIFDTPGVDVFDKFRKIDYEGTDAFVLCYDVTNADSFGNVEERWIPELREACKDVPIILLGTKVDIREDIAAAIAEKEKLLASEEKLEGFQFEKQDEEEKFTGITTEEGLELKQKFKLNGFFECSCEQPSTVKIAISQAVLLAQQKK